MTGFTGRYVARNFIESGYEVYGLSHSSKHTIDGVKQNYAVSLSDYTGLQQVIDTVKPHYVIHLAAISFVAYSNISELYSTNIIGTRNLLEALKTSSILPENVIVASSANVYGNNTSGKPLDELTPLSPVNDYAVTKVSCEYICSLYSDIFPIIITRPFNYTGVFQANNFLVPKIIQAAKTKQTVIELGNLDISRDFSDVRDVAKFYFELIQTSSNGLRFFNICSGQAHSLYNILEYVQQAADYRFNEVRVNQSFVRNNEIKLLLGNPSCLNSNISDASRYTLKQTIEWMIGH